MSDADRKTYEDLLAQGGDAIVAQNDGLGPNQRIRLQGHKIEAWI